MRVRNFPVVSKKKKKKATIASCRLLFGETGALQRPKSSPLSVCVNAPHTWTHNHQQYAAFQDIFHIKNTTYLFRIVHSGIFSLSTFFPLSRSTVRPASAPLWPLLWSPPPPRGTGPVKLCGSATTHPLPHTERRSGRCNVTK